MVDGIVFDIDGVLLNTEASYPQVIVDATQRTVAQCLGVAPEADPALVLPTETRLFKAAGGFNSDWHLAMGCSLHYLVQAALLGAPGRMPSLAELRSASPSLAEFAQSLPQGQGLPAAEEAALARLTPSAQEWVRSQYNQAAIERTCCELYGGGDWCETLFGFVPLDYTGPGYCNREELTLNVELLRTAGKKYGIYSGRYHREALPVLERCTLNGLPEATMRFADGQYVKPNPQGLLAISEHYRLRMGIFVGDNVDDARTVQNYKRQYPGAPGFLFCGITTGTLGEASEQIFTDMGADIIATDVNALLRWLSGR